MQVFTFRRGIFAALLLLAIAMAALCSRIWALERLYETVDEEIPLAVLQAMKASGQPDTNWARTEISEVFCYGQFNFSSCHLFAALFSNTARINLERSPGEQRRLKNHLRRLSAILGALNVLLASILLTGLCFMQSRVFFECNLSHALPFLFIGGGAGLRQGHTCGNGARAHNTR